jgi:hypothetical protein
MTSDRTLLWTVSLLGGFFFLSLGLYFLLPGHLVRTVLAFPDEISHRLSSEARSLPFNGDREHNAELLVREVLLGPSRHNHLRLFSREAEVGSVLVRQGTIYVDLKKDSLIPDPDVIYSPVTALKVLKATLLDNFWGISDVRISVDGEPAQGNIVDKG